MTYALANGLTMRNDSGAFNEEEFLTYSEEYADYIMKHCGGDRVICNGDALTEAQESHYLFDEFLQSRGI